MKAALQSALQGDISDFKDVTTDGLVQHILSVGKTSMDTYSRNNLVAAELTGTAPLPDGNETVLATVFFNAQTYHAIGLAVATIDAAILKYVSTSTYSLEVTNHPLPRTKESELEQDAQSSSDGGFALAINFIFGVSFMVGHFWIPQIYLIWVMKATLF